MGLRRTPRRESGIAWGVHSGLGCREAAEDGKSVERDAGVLLAVERGASVSQALKEIPQASMGYVRRQIFAPPGDYNRRMLRSLCSPTEDGTR